MSTHLSEFVAVFRRKNPLRAELTVRTNVDSSAVFGIIGLDEAVPFLLRVRAEVL